MHDLRKKILLESKKTTSRKARTRPESSRGSNFNSPSGSPGHSQPASRANSRPGSRYASEDENDSDSDFEDSMTMSTASVGSDDATDEASRDIWADRLQTRISQLENRKGSSTQGRIETLMAYLHLLRHHFAKSHVEGSLLEIVGALLKSIKSGGSGQEMKLALKALSVTVLTCSSDNIFERAYPALKTVCEDSEDEGVTAQSLYTMAITVLYGGGSEQAAEDLLQFLIEAVESDGQTVMTPDSGPVVSAALESWAFVASHLDDLSDHVDQAIEAFVEQLDSTDPEVSTMAGSNIALLFEVAREHEEETGEALNIAYDPKRLISRMSELARGSKSISKRDRRHVRQNFSNVITSLELGKGPGYKSSNRPASNPHTGGSKLENDAPDDSFGYRDKLRIDDKMMVIDSWALSRRVDMMRAVLGGGFPIHYMRNPEVMDILSSAKLERLGR